MQNIFKSLNIFIILVVFCLSFMSPALATDDYGIKNTAKEAGYTGEGSENLTNRLGTDKSIAETIGSIINVILSVIGTLFFLLLIYTGFIWMNSKGNETEVKKALSIIQQALIGLAIVLLAYAITRFIF